MVGLGSYNVEDVPRLKRAQGKKTIGIVQKQNFISQGLGDLAGIMPENLWVI